MASHRPRNPVGWLFHGGGLSASRSAVATDIYARHATGRPHRPSGRLGCLGSARLLGSWVSCSPLALLLFPDGRLPSRRWRVLAWLYRRGRALLLLMTVSSSAALAARDLGCPSRRSG